MGSSKDKFEFYWNLCLRHQEAKIIIAEDGEAMRCDLCGMYTMDLMRHKKSKTCRLNQERRIKERVHDQQAEAGEQKFFVYGHQLERVRKFQYLGRTLRDNDDDSRTIVNQIRKARGK